jgi:hypothetical protein
MICCRKRNESEAARRHTSAQSCAWTRSNAAAADVHVSSSTWTVSEGAACKCMECRRFMGGGGPEGASARLRDEGERG